GRLEGRRHLQAEVAARHAPLVHELPHHALDQVDWDAEGHPAVAARGGGDGGVDADDLAVEVDEGSAAGAGVDGGVGLEEVLDADGVPERDLAAIASADDAVRYRLIEPERTAGREQPAAHARRIAVAVRRGRQGL